MEKKFKIKNTIIAILIIISIIIAIVFINYLINMLIVNQQMKTAINAITINENVPLYSTAKEKNEIKNLDIGTNVYVLKNITDKNLLILKIFTCILLVLGSFLSPALLWNLVDIMAAVLAIINIYAIFSLKRVMIEEYQFYKRKCQDDRK